MAKSTMSIVLPADIKEWLKIYAIRHGTTASDVIRRSIEALRDTEGDHVPRKDM